MKQFFRTIKQVCSSTSVYCTAQNESGWKGIVLLLKLCLFIGLVVGSIGLIVLLVVLPSVKSRITDFATTSYPEGLVVTIENGTLTANTTEPVVVPVPPSWKSEESSEEQSGQRKMRANLFVLAPNEEANLSVLETHDAFVVATSKAVVVESDTQTRIYPYGKEKQVITKASFLNIVNGIKKVGGVFVLCLAIPAGVMVVFFTLIGHLIWLLVIVLVVWIICRLMKRNLSYKQLYRIGLYALVPVMLVDIVAVPLGVAGKLLTAAIVGIIFFVVLKNQTSGEGKEMSTQQVL